ncbi:MAG: 3-dehydroquinate synthase [Proteobacteria bacterium]|uniref:3-dehydroquinate synthase n=1 Tax=Rudaea sp. TaxID=2136325 RepID=UPI003784A29A|nr:3-dehydroquinate synthase [Pseudomonadota bacterium]
MTAAPVAPIELGVELGARSYPIAIGAGLLGDAPRIAAAICGRHALIVSNDVVAPLYLERLENALLHRGDDVLQGEHRASLPGMTVTRLLLPDGEAFKTLASAAQVFDALAAMKANRDATIIALGGGVIGDLAGFAAACWMRGIAFVQVPTTLLAMVDSSVGGKTAVDLAQGKNLVGAFHQPRAVIADTDTLATLPARELRAGFAEVIKYGALGDAEFFAGLERNADALLAREGEALTATIAHCCRQKAGIVARDETEQGERALLNLGHTFGHAIETAMGYGGLLHGEAVAVGMVLAARLSANLGRAAAADTHRLVALLERFGLPTTVPAGLDPDRLIGLMQLDKKNLSGSLRLILWRGVGKADVVPDVDLAAVRAVLAQAT